MANRHSHKKRRAEIRARMQATGESYQQALSHIAPGARGPQAEPERAFPPPRDFDLVRFSFFGVPMTLVTATGPVLNAIAVMPHAARSSAVPWLPRMSLLHPRGCN